MARLLRDRYFWLIVTVIVFSAVLIYAQGWRATVEEWYLTYMIFYRVLFLLVVAIAAWRFGAGGGLAACLAIGLVVLPYVIGMSMDRWRPDLLAEYMIIGTIAVVLSWRIGSYEEGRQSLHKAHNHLESRVRERTSQLAEVNEQLEMELGERMQVEEALRALSEREAKSAREWEELFDAADEIIALISPDFEILRINRAGFEVVGKKREELIGKKCYEVVHGLDRPIAGCPCAETLKTKQAGVGEITQGGRHYIASASPIMDKNGEVAAFTHTITDITERKQAEEEFKRSNKFSETILNSMNDAISVIDVYDYRIARVNRNFLKQVGLKKEEQVIGKTCYQVTHQRSSPCQPPDDICPLLESVASGGHAVAEHVHHRADGKKVYVEVATSPLKDEKGKVVQVVHVARDITERREAERQIKASLAEKELLLKEIHHRVKNNMQVISSLLKLRSGKIEDKKIRELFDDSQNRIRSMALVYNKLYQSADLTRIGLKDYVTELADGLIQSYRGTPSKVATKVEGDNISLGVDLAIPCGLFINELITNSLKYAFPNGRSGLITVSLRGADEDEVEIIVSDNGVGIPDDIDPAKTNTLGLYLVTMLVENQLGGKLELDRSKGTKFRITFNRNQ